MNKIKQAEEFKIFYTENILSWCDHIYYDEEIIESVAIVVSWFVFVKDSRLWRYEQITFDFLKFDSVWDRFFLNKKSLIKKMNILDKI